MTTQQSRRLVVLMPLFVVFTVVSSFAFAQDAPITGSLVIYRDIERLTIYIDGEGAVALGQVGFRIGDDDPIFLSGYPEFAAINFEQLNLPACFSLLYYQSRTPMPLNCQNLPEVRVFTSVRATADIFWYDGVMAANRVISLVNGDQAIPDQCPGSAPACEFDLNLFAQPISVSVPPVFTNDERAAQWLVAEFAGYSLKIDDRLSLLDPILTMLLHDPTSAEMDAAREQLYPTLADDMTDEFQRQLAAEMITETGRLLADYPLPTALDDVLLNRAIDSDMDPFKVREVYEQLNQVQWATSNLMTALQAALEADPGDTEWLEYLARRVALQRDTLYNRSMIAHLSVLYALADLTAVYPSLDTGMEALVWLDPREPVTDDDYAYWLDVHVQYAEALQTDRQHLIVLAETLTVEKSDVSVEAILEATRILPDDPPEVVVGKIRTLREYGLIDDALAAIRQYGEMFAADETTPQYVAVSTAYTLEFTDMDLPPSAVYLWMVDPEGVAGRAGLETGDILIRWNGDPLTGADDMQARLEQTPLGTPINFTFLRLQDDGTFVRGVVSLVRESMLGIGMMPL